MKLVILAGGLGTRISEETKTIPKPMVLLDEYPIIFHIMRYYSYFNVKEFIICTGYKHEIINKYFKKNNFIDWKIKLVFTGIKSNTGKRILKIKKYLKKDENFFVTYGDGLSNINLSKLKDIHLKKNKVITVSVVRPLPRFGKVKFYKNGYIKSFEEKKKSDDWISGGFFVFNKKIFSFMKNKNKNYILEKDVIPKVVKKKMAVFFKHSKFWQCMDTLREKYIFQNLLKLNKAPWIKKNKNLDFHLLKFRR
jgi:glucose-1-phosphate cytidylyltransferase